jgi:hypothetical protein
LRVTIRQSLAKALDSRADIFALGTIMFELITLKRAWVRSDDGRPMAWDVRMIDGELNSQIAVLKRISWGARPRASLEQCDLPPTIDEVLARARR